jgi:hypothetical protein
MKSVHSIYINKTFHTKYLSLYIQRGIAKYLSEDSSAQRPLSWSWRSFENDVWAKLRGDLSQQDTNIYKTRAPDLNYWDHAEQYGHANAN